ncbi:MAG: phosphatase PAP2 family protein [Sphaerochaetaceae bacterium]|nr:phosphatase PAP2 family protein [Sphaerochaetaceae bacterium]
MDKKLSPLAFLLLFFVVFALVLVGGPKGCIDHVDTYLDKVGDFLLYLSLGFAIAFGGFGLYLLFCKKKLELSLVYLGAFYVLLIVINVFFENIPISFRPNSINSVLEPSFPSTHVLFTTFILQSGVCELKFLFGSKKAFSVFGIISVVISFAMVFLRVLSGLHWVTDVLSAFFLSMSLVRFFEGSLIKIDLRSQKQNQQ